MRKPRFLSGDLYLYQQVNTLDCHFPRALFHISKKLLAVPSNPQTSVVDLNSPHFHSLQS